LLLDHLLGALAVSDVLNARPGVAVTDLAYDSRRVSAGTLFFCVPGEHRDGHDHAGDAARRGAAALVVQHPVAVSAPQIIVADSRAAMAPAADRFFGEPTRQLRVIGVTGTNGKTTTSFLVRSILEASGSGCGLIGTVEQRIGGVAEKAARTTGEAIDLQRTFRRMLDAGDRACAMEVSSHALALHRVDDVRFAAAIFTNLTHDHLDFHGSMEEYFAAKQTLFDGRCPRAVNADDAYGARLAAELRFGVNAAGDVRAEQVMTALDATRFRLVTPAGDTPVTLRLRGAFNVANALAAAAGALLVGVALPSIQAGLAALAGVPGRFETVDAGQPFMVVVDYAHTPDALANVLRAARGVSDGRVLVVFGCGGDRDRGKRPQMGRVAAALADDVIVTTDNPRSEDPEAIIREIVAGTTTPVTIEPDRRRAIHTAIGRAGAGDVVVIAGKGHEQGQETCGETTPFDDRHVAREALT
jgi:UDP-N-acetylmuramoyl-L-alanyl-D-glutamate--2,6-diaminopimelate ligase